MFVERISRPVGNAFPDKQAAGAAYALAEAKYVDWGATAKMDQLKSKRLRITLPRNAAFTVKVRAQPEHLSLQDEMMRVCWIETDLST